MGDGARIKTTVEVSDELYRRANAEAAKSRRSLKDLIEEGLRLVLEAPPRKRSLSDACIARMAELYERHAVLTLDSDFAVYRKHGNIPLSLISAPDR